MNVGSLFSGIGGLDLGLERAGMTVVWQSEIDPYASRVLAKHWPHVPNLGDITLIDWSTVEPVDLICGGYPCQPFSLAGTRAGENDARHLWPYFADALRELRPRFALLENVPGHLSMGFGEVLADLASLGYDTDWDCIPAAAVGAPHLRYRVFVVAHTNGQGEPGEPVDALTRSRLMVPDTNGDGLRQQPVGVGGRGDSTIALDDREALADSDGGGFGPDKRTVHGEQPDPGRSGAQLADADNGRRNGRTRLIGQGWRGQSENGGQWAVEPDVGRVAHGVPSRVDRLKCLGNAVVPQVAEWVGRRIMAVTP